MKFEKRILVAIKGSGDLDAVVQRASLIGSRLKAELILMPSSRSLHTQAQERTERAYQALSQQGLAVTVRERTHKNLLSDLVLSAKALECGLLMKAPDHPRGLADALLTPRDWKLLRYAPCPVLMIKQGQSWRGRPVLAAVDVTPGNSAHDQLNRQIVQLADQVASLAECPLELVTAFPAPMQSGDRSQQSESQLVQRYHTLVEDLCRHLGIHARALHVDAGPAETLIPRIAESCDAGLVVLGTVARRGLAAALMGGNTAEAILSHLKGDILTVQPAVSDEVLALLAETANEEEGA